MASPSHRRNPFKRLMAAFHRDEEFLWLMEGVEGLVSRVLSVAMVLVILVACIDLVLLLTGQLLAAPMGFFNTTLQDIFGAFLSILIALEILENITAYLRKHVVQVELVVATSLTAVARKIIILDLDKIDGLELIGLALAILALAISYWLIRAVTPVKGRTTGVKRLKDALRQSRDRGDRDTI
jgi:uncharacterized membrane protein (DUF373 family)